MYLYTAYELTIRSEFPFPELLPVRELSDGTADVTVRQGEVDPPPTPGREDEKRLIAEPDEAFFTHDVGRFSIRNGTEILVDQASGVSREVLRQFVLGPAFAALLHQRGLLLLHAGSIATPDCAATFLGEPGSGKSTLTGATYAHGHGVMADDVTAVRISDGSLRVLPAFPRLKLDAETAASLGIDSPSRSSAELEKRFHDVHRGFPREPRCLGGIYLLVEGPTGRIEPLSRREAVIELIRHSYTPRLVAATDGASAQFRQCASVATDVPVKRLRRPTDLQALPEVVQAIEDDLLGAVC